MKISLFMLTNLTIVKTSYYVVGTLCLLSLHNKFFLHTSFKKEIIGINNILDFILFEAYMSSNFPVWLNVKGIAYKLNPGVTNYLNKVNLYFQT